MDQNNVNEHTRQTDPNNYRSNQIILDETLFNPGNSGTQIISPFLLDPGIENYQTVILNDNNYVLIENEKLLSNQQYPLIQLRSTDDLVDPQSQNKQNKNLLQELSEARSHAIQLHLSKTDETHSTNYGDLNDRDNRTYARFKRYQELEASRLSSESHCNVIPTQSSEIYNIPVTSETYNMNSQPSEMYNIPVTNEICNLTSQPNQIYTLPVTNESCNITSHPSEFYNISLSQPVTSETYNITSHNSPNFFTDEPFNPYLQFNPEFHIIEEPVMSLPKAPIGVTFSQVIKYVSSNEDSEVMALRRGSGVPKTILPRKQEDIKKEESFSENWNKESKLAEKCQGAVSEATHVFTEESNNVTEQNIKYSETVPIIEENTQTSGTIESDEETSQDGSDVAEIVEEYVVTLDDSQESVKHFAYGQNAENIKNQYMEIDQDHTTVERYLSSKSELHLEGKRNDEEISECSEMSQSQFRESETCEEHYDEHKKTHKTDNETKNQNYVKRYSEIMQHNVEPYLQEYAEQYVAEDINNQEGGVYYKQKYNVRNISKDLQQPEELFVSQEANTQSVEFGSKQPLSVQGNEKNMTENELKGHPDNQEFANQFTSQEIDSNFKQMQVGPYIQQYTAESEENVNNSQEIEKLKAELYIDHRELQSKDNKDGYQTEVETYIEESVSDNEDKMQVGSFNEENLKVNQIEIGDYIDNNQSEQIGECINETQGMVEIKVEESHIQEDLQKIVDNVGEMEARPCIQQYTEQQSDIEETNSQSEENSSHEFEQNQNEEISEDLGKDHVEPDTEEYPPEYPHSLLRQHQDFPDESPQKVKASVEHQCQVRPYYQLCMEDQESTTSHDDSLPRGSPIQKAEEHVVHDVGTENQSYFQLYAEQENEDSDQNVDLTEEAETFKKGYVLEQNATEEIILYEETNNIPANQLLSVSKIEETAKLTEEPRTRNNEYVKTLIVSADIILHKETSDIPKDMPLCVPKINETLNLTNEEFVEKRSVIEEVIRHEELEIPNEECIKTHNVIEEELETPNKEGILYETNEEETVDPDIVNEDYIEKHNMTEEVILHEKLQTSNEEVMLHEKTNNISEKESFNLTEGPEIDNEKHNGTEEVILHEELVTPNKEGILHETNEEETVDPDIVNEDYSEKHNMAEEVTLHEELQTPKEVVILPEKIYCISEKETVNLTEGPEIDSEKHNVTREVILHEKTNNICKGETVGLTEKPDIVNEETEEINVHKVLKTPKEGNILQEKANDISEEESVVHTEDPDIVNEDDVKKPSVTEEVFLPKETNDVPEEQTFDLTEKSEIISADYAQKPNVTEAAFLHEETNDISEETVDLTGDLDIVNEDYVEKVSWTEDICEKKTVGLTEEPEIEDYVKKHNVTVEINVHKELENYKEENILQEKTNTISEEERVVQTDIVNEDYVEKLSVTEEAFLPEETNDVPEEETFDLTEEPDIVNEDYVEKPGVTEKAILPEETNDVSEEETGYLTDDSEIISHDYVQKSNVMEEVILHEETNEDTLPTDETDGSFYHGQKVELQTPGEPYHQEYLEQDNVTEEVMPYNEELIVEDALSVREMEKNQSQELVDHIEIKPTEEQNEEMKHDNIIEEEYALDEINIQNEEVIYVQELPFQKIQDCLDDMQETNSQTSIEGSSQEYLEHNFISEEMLGISLEDSNETGEITEEISEQQIEESSIISTEASLAFTEAMHQEDEIPSENTIASKLVMEDISVEETQTLHINSGREVVLNEEWQETTSENVTRNEKITEKVEVSTRKSRGRPKKASKNDVETKLSLASESSCIANKVSVKRRSKKAVNKHMQNLSERSGNVLLKNVGDAQTQGVVDQKHKEIKIRSRGRPPKKKLLTQQNKLIEHPDNGERVLPKRPLRTINMEKSVRDIDKKIPNNLSEDTIVDTTGSLNKKSKGRPKNDSTTAPDNSESELPHKPLRTIKMEKSMKDIEQKIPNNISEDTIVDNTGLPNKKSKGRPRNDSTTALGKRKRIKVTEEKLSTRPIFNDDVSDDEVIFKNKPTIQRQIPVQEPILPNISSSAAKRSRVQQIKVHPETFKRAILKKIKQEPVQQTSEPIEKPSHIKKEPEDNLRTKHSSAESPGDLVKSWLLQEATKPKTLRLRSGIKTAQSLSEEVERDSSEEPLSRLLDEANKPKTLRLRTGIKAAHPLPEEAETENREEPQFSDSIVEITAEDIGGDEDYLRICGTEYVTAEKKRKEKNEVKGQKGRKRKISNASATSSIEESGKKKRKMGDETSLSIKIAQFLKETAEKERELENTFNKVESQIKTWITNKPVKKRISNISTATASDIQVEPKTNRRIFVSQNLKQRKGLKRISAGVTKTPLQEKMSPSNTSTTPKSVTKRVIKTKRNSTTETGVNQKSPKEDTGENVASKKAEDDVELDDDSDTDSRKEWLPEDYAEYKYKYTMKKFTQKRSHFQCKVCLAIVPSYYMLQKHKLKHDKDNPYECSQCDQTFEHVQELHAHIRLHKGKAPYKCTKCGRGFMAKDEYDNHQQIHILKKEPPKPKRFRCDICGKEFSKLCDMDRHLRVHTGEKPAVCHICNKGFQQAHNLSQHLLTHLAVKPFVCELCNKKFGRIDVLNRHLLTHSMEKPFKCEFCPKGFIRASQFRKHVKTVHPDLGVDQPETVEES